MRRILAISIAAAIPAVLPVHAADAHTKPAPPPRAHHRTKPAPRPANGTHGANGMNDAQGNSGGNETRGPSGAHDAGTNGTNSTDDAHGPGGAGDANGAGEAHGAGGPSAANNGHSANGAGGQHAGHSGHHARPAPRSDAHGQPASRPGTGADTGYSEPADAEEGAPAIAPEAVAASKAVDQLDDPTSPASQLMLRTTGGTAAERTVTLRCDPPGGTHPNAIQACADVAKTHGDFKQLAASKDPRACFMIYAPVTVTAQGDWRGQAVRFSQRFPNTCVMRDKTGSIFDF